MAEHWQKLSLNDREEKNLELTNENSTNEFILAAKFLTKRALNVEAIIKTFSPFVAICERFEVRRAGDHILLFVFDNKEEATTTKCIFSDEKIRH